MTWGFVVVGAGICALAGALSWARGPVRAHGEDRVGGDGGADRVLQRGAGRATIEHIGSAHDEARGGGAEGRRAAAAGRPGRASWIWAWHGCRPAAGGPLPITVLADGAPVGRAVPRLRGARVRRRPPAGMRCSGQLVLARIIEPTSKLDSLRVLDEVGVDAPSYRDAQTAAAGLREDRVAAAARRGVRGARRAGPGDAGALRRDHAVLRDRRR